MTEQANISATPSRSLFGKQATRREIDAAIRHFLHSGRTAQKLPDEMAPPRFVTFQTEPLDAEDRHALAMANLCM